MASAEDKGAGGEGLSKVGSIAWDSCHACGRLLSIGHAVTCDLLRPAIGLREALAWQMEEEIRPLLGVNAYKGGYDCCGCSTYDLILDHAIRIVRGENAE